MEFGELGFDQRIFLQQSPPPDIHLLAILTPIVFHSHTYVQSIAAILRNNITVSKVFPFSV